MKAWMTKHKDKSVEVTVRVDDVTDLINHVLLKQMTEKIAEKFMEEYYTDIIKRVDPKVLAAFITVEAAKKAVK